MDMILEKLLRGAKTFGDVLIWLNDTEVIGDFVFGYKDKKTRISEKRSSVCFKSRYPRMTYLTYPSYFCIKFIGKNVCIYQKKRGFVNFCCGVICIAVLIKIPLLFIQKVLKQSQFMNERKSVRKKYAVDLIMQ